MTEVQNTKSKKTNRSRFVPALFVAAVAFAGCGSEMTTSPILLGTQSGTGEMILPERHQSIDTPKNLAAQFSAPGSMTVTWSAPEQGFTAIVLRDGVEVGRVPAQDGTFTEVMPYRIPGVNTFVYSVCFGRGTQLGPETTVVGYLPRQDGQDLDPRVDSAG